MTVRSLCITTVISIYACSSVPTDLHWIDPGSSESLPDPAHLHRGTDPGIQGQEDRRDASTYLRHRRQQLHQHETIRAGPVYHHQVIRVSLFQK